MLDQSLIQSGFDAEILLGEHQLTAVLLGLVDAGTIPAIPTGGPNDTPLPLQGPAFVDRTYEPHPDSPGLPPVGALRHPFEVEILFNQAADVRVHLVIQSPFGEIQGDLFISLVLETDRDDAGSVEAARLVITVLAVESPAIPSLEAIEDLHVTKASILADVKAAVDRSVDLGGLSAFKRIQDIAMQKLPADGDHPSAFGLYLNLRIQTGPQPESLKEARGDLAKARNFLPAGSHSAMVTRAGLYGDLAADAFNRFAEIDENGNVSHPWYKSPFDKNSERRGKIIGVRVAPILNTTTLKIDIEVEYQVDNFFDPNAHMIVELTPSTDINGALKWSVNVDFHASLALEIIGFAVLAGLATFGFAIGGVGLAAAIAGGFITGSFLDFGGHLFVDALFSGKKERKALARIPDVVSGRVEVAQRRWDPFYTTHHHIAMRPDGALVNANGVALWGRAVLDKELEVVEHAVIRDKRIQEGSPPTHLRYRIDDADSFREEFEALAPGTDRRPFEQVDREGEPTIFDLSIEEIVARIAERRIMPDIAYVAKRIDLRQNTVHSILTISQREINETRDEVIIAFEATTRENVVTEEGEEIRNEILAGPGGGDLTPEELDALVQKFIDVRVASLVEAFLNGPIDEAIEEALLPKLLFDLSPGQFATLEKKKILHLIGLQVVTMHSLGHEGFMYYRDKPDSIKPDNLHSLPRYRETPEGPEIL